MKHIELKIKEILSNKESITKQIIIADNQAEKTLHLQAILSSEEYQILTFSSGVEAIQEIMKTKTTALVIAGLRLADMDGFKFASLIKKDSFEQPPRLLFVSDIGTPDDLVIEALQLGANDFIDYSIDSNILKLKILAQLRCVEKQEAYQKSQEAINVVSSRLSKKNKELVDSIEYASAIQKSIFVSEDHIASRFENTFIVHQAKDLVGGDFYWIDELNSRMISICADCTGHGVPGAFLTMISHQILETVIRENRKFDAGTILTLIHQKFIKIFGSDSVLQHQGMDASVCIYNRETRQLEYASAKGRILFQEGDDLVRLKGDFVSVGDCLRPNHTYSTESLLIKEPTWVFQFTDGIVDQFGGGSNKKYQIRRLERLLAENLNSSCSRLKEVVWNEFVEWKGALEQTDDILISGIKVG